MSYNGSGTFQINTSGQPVVAGTVISSTAFNALTADLATGLSTAITKDGQTTTTARIPFSQGVSSTLTTDATSTASGSIITAGGVGIAKAIYVGTTSNLAGSVTFGSTIVYGGVTLSAAVTGTGKMVLDTSPTISLPVIDNIKMGYSTTVTAAGTTTLTAASNYRQFFTGSTTQTIVLPVTSTLVTGIAYEIENNSTGLLTVNSSGGNLVGTIPSGVCAHAVCIGTTLTTAADWDWDYISNTSITGTGSAVLATSPTVNNPTVTNYVESVVAIGTVTSSNTIALTNGTVQTATLTASTACTFTMPTATAGKSFILLLKQAAATGNGTATFTGVKWGTSGAPTITATAGKMDILTFVADGTNWYGSIAQGYTP